MAYEMRALFKLLLCQPSAIFGLSSLLASSPGHSVGQAGKGRRACNYVSRI